MSNLDLLIAQAREDIKSATIRLQLLESLKSKEEVKNLLTVEETADIIGISPQSVRLWVKQNKLKVCKPGRRVLVYRDSVNSIMEKGQGGIGRS